MAESNEVKVLWVVDDGIISRFYNKITKSWKPKDSDESRKVTHENVTITVPQSLEEVPEHSVLSALDLCKWAIAYKKYLRYRELIPTGAKQEVIEDRVNRERIGQISEMSTTNQVVKRVKAANLTDDQAKELQAFIDNMLES